MDDQQKRLFVALILCAGLAVMWQMFFMPTAPPRQEAEGTGAEQATEERGASDATDPANSTAEVIVADGSGQYFVSDGTGHTVTAELPHALPEVELLPPQRLVSTFSADDDEATYAHSVYLRNGGAALSAVDIQAPEQYIPSEPGVFPHEGLPIFPVALRIPGVEGLEPTSTFKLEEDESVPVVIPEAPEGETQYERVVYSWSNGFVEIEKIFTADPERPYTTAFQVVVRNLGVEQQHIDGLEVLVVGDDSGGEARGFFNPVANSREAACYVGEELKHETSNDLESPAKPEHMFQGAVAWAGIYDRYFLVAVSAANETAGSGCRLEQSGESFFISSLLVDGFDVAPGEEVRLDFHLYTGPKDSDALAVAGPSLDRSINFGIFSFLAYPMRWVLKNAFKIVGNWGLAIIMLTVLVKALMFPWTHKSFKSMERMKAIQPKLNALREKYKNDRTKMTEETMKLYKEHNVSPFGCLPMLLQMPIYIALYRTIYSSVELYHADFALWINDLSARDPYYILPVLMAATMFGQQLLTPMATDNPQMKWVMRGMPIMFGVFMLVLPSGLVLYIFVSSLLGIAQQYWIRRQFAKEKEEDDTPTTPSSKQTRQQRRRATRRQST